MSWNSLKAGIAAIIKANGNQEITGTNMQSVLYAMVNGLGQNATFAGVAVPSTNPGVPDGPVFYIAGRQGRYSNFGNVRFDTVNAFGVFVWDGTQWNLNVVELSISSSGGGGGGSDIDPSIAEFTQSRVTIKKPLYLNDDLILDDTLISGVAEFYAVETYTGLISVDEIRKGSGTQQLAIEVYDPVIFDGNVSIRGFLDMDDVWIEDGAIRCESITIGSGDDEVTIEDGVISGTSIDVAAISTSTILLDGSDLGNIIDGINAKIAGISRTTSGNTNTTVVADNLEVSGGLSISGGAMIGGNVNCDDIFCGLVEATGFVTDGGLNIVSELTDIAALVDAIKEAQGEEVGDATTTAIGAGVLIWHNGDLYKTNSPIPSGTTWANMDVVQTTVSAEINALRGVAIESVVLNITPASAIPAAGVKARIYNVTTQTYMPEVTFTPNFNRALLGVVSYGDVYTIVMPSIEGYTQPADQTFQANQILRDRTVEYVPVSVPSSENIVIKATLSNGGTIGDVNVIVRTYNDQGGIDRTITLSLAGGTCENLALPFGTKYSVAYPTISGYITPSVVVCTARASSRIISASYIWLLSDVIQWVRLSNNLFTYIDYDNETDLQAAINDGTLFGVAFLSSNLQITGYDGRFIYRFSQNYLSGKWSSVLFDIPRLNRNVNNNLYRGEPCTNDLYDAILQYEAENNVTISSVFKAIQNVHSGIYNGDTEVKYFVPAGVQVSEIQSRQSALNAILARLGSVLVVNRGIAGWMPTQDSKDNGTVCHGVNNYGNYNKNTVRDAPIVLPLLTSTSTTEQPSNT